MAIIRYGCKRIEVQAGVLSLLDSLGPEGITITKHGQPVARLIPASADGADLIGSAKGRIQVRGNILSTGVKWNADS